MSRPEDEALGVADRGVFEQPESLESDAQIEGGVDVGGLQGDGSLQAGPRLLDLAERLQRHAQIRVVDAVLWSLREGGSDLGDSVSRATALKRQNAEQVEGVWLVRHKP